MPPFPRMTPAAASPSNISSGRSSFDTTRWTQVRRAKANDDSGQSALAALCDAYYEPVLAFLRCELRDADAARDLAHEFFARLLAGGALEHADTTHGRFRSYLLGAVKHFLSNQREMARSLKRGGGVVPASLDEDASAVRKITAENELSPDETFDRHWALTVVARSLEALKQECLRDGKGEFFEHVKPWITGESSHGEQIQLAEACGMTPAALKMALQRLKKKLRDEIWRQVTETLDDASLADEEMKSLFAALSR
jgi:DNA-directed RNA polymerase specialized sigma24 family protein